MISYEEWVQNGLGVWGEGCWDGLSFEVEDEVRAVFGERITGALLCFVRLRGPADRPEWVATVEWESTIEDDEGYVFSLHGACDLTGVPNEAHWKLLVMEISGRVIWELGKPEYVR